MRVRYGFLIGVGLLLALVALAGAQQVIEMMPETETTEKEEVGLIRGVVTDATDRNAPIRGATVEYANGRGIQGSVTTDIKGNYQIEQLPPGQYRINVRAEGYAPREGLTTVVMAGRESVFNIPLRPKPSLLGSLAQNRIVLVIFGFVLGLLIGVLLGAVIRSK